MTRSVALAVDLGASGGRVLAGTCTAGRLAIEEVHRFENGPVSLGGELVWDLPRLWQEVVLGLRSAGSHYGEAVASVGVDTWGVDFALLGADGRLLANPVCYRDGRTRGMIAAAERTVSRADIFAATGLQFMELNTLYQVLALQAARSSVLAAAERMLLMPDLFHWLLSGERFTERTNASTTQCYDPRTRDWAFPMLDRFGLPRRIFGPLADPGTVLGELRGDVAADTGLHGVRVILPGTHDTASAIAAVPAVAAPGEWAYVSLGTWALVGAELGEPLVTSECLARNFTNEGGVGGTTRLLKNVCGLWLVQQCRAAWQRDGQAWTWDRLTSLAAESPPLVTLVDPDHPTLVAPADMPEAIRALAGATGEPVPHTTGAVVRAALESVAAGVRRTLGELDALVGRRLGTVHVVGGGVQNRLLCQMIADATDRPVIAGPVEATAIGNLLVQLIARDGRVDLARIREIVRTSFDPVRYEPRDAARWNERLGAAGRP